MDTSHLEPPSQKILTATEFFTGDYNGDGKSDLFSLAKSGTGSNATEVHILDGASNYQEWILRTGTPISEDPAGPEFFTGDYNGRW